MSAVYGEDDANVAAYTVKRNDGMYIVEAFKCFLCNHAFVDGEKSWFMFQNRVGPDGRPECALSSILSSALGKNIEEFTAHSNLLCLNCSDSVLEYELLEKRVCEVRYNILTAYNRTAHYRNLAPIVIHMNGVIQNAPEIINSESLDEKIIVPPNCEPAEHRLSDPLSNDSPYKTSCTSLVEEVAEGVTTIKTENAANKSTENLLDAVNMQDVDFVDSDPNMSGILIEGQDIINYDEIITQSPETNFDDAGIDSQPQSEHDYEATDNVYDDIIQQLTEERSSEYDGHTVVEQPFEQLGELFKCQLCSNPEELDAKQFTEHVRIMHNKRFFSCDLCGNGFLSRPALNLHYDECHTNCQFECETCHEVFSNYRHFLVHKRKHLRTSKPFECSVCFKKYVTKSVLEEHMNMHTGTRPYKCTHCPKDFASKYTLQTHLKIHTKRERLYQCAKCVKSFFNYQNLVNHSKLHAPSKSYECAECPKSFGSRHNLDLHKIIHTGQRPFVCRICGKSFLRKADTRDHERTHTGERPFKCDTCPSAFAQRSNLMSHKKLTHLNQKSHKCEICDRSFKRRRLLDYHIHSVHTGERPFKCNLCEASFVYPEHYKKHLVIHSGQKPFACEVCGKQFNSRDNRNAHRFVHSDKKPFECLECGAGFMRKPLLLAHFKVANHSDKTIIVNKAQINVDTNACYMPTDQEILSKIDTVQSIEVPANILAEDEAENDNDNDNEIENDETVMDIKLEELEVRSPQGISWVDMN